MGKLVVDIEDLDPALLNRACRDVIDALSKHPPAYKVGALHTLLASFPVPYEIIESKKQ